MKGVEFSQFDTASVYIDSDFKVVDAMGAFAKYAQLPETGFSLDLLKMLPDNLKTAVNSATRKAKRTKSDFIYKNVATQKAGVDTLVNVIVKPIFKNNKANNPNNSVKGIREMNIFFMIYLIVVP